MSEFSTIVNQHKKENTMERVTHVVENFFNFQVKDLKKFDSPRSYWYMWMESVWPAFGINDGSEAEQMKLKEFVPYLSCAGISFGYLKYDVDKSSDYKKILVMCYYYLVSFGGLKDIYIKSFVNLKVKDFYAYLKKIDYDAATMQEKKVWKLYSLLSQNMGKSCYEETTIYDVQYLIFETLKKYWKPWEDSKKYFTMQRRCYALIDTLFVESFCKVCHLCESVIEERNRRLLPEEYENLTPEHESDAIDCKIPSNGKEKK